MFMSKVILYYIFYLISLWHFTYGNRYRSYGPSIKATVGEVWPKPLTQYNTGQYYGVDPNDFELVAVNKNCMLMKKAIQRYTTIIKNSIQSYIRAPETITISQIQQIRVNLTEKCETLPHLNMDESYFVWSDGDILAHSVWGILRGLETLSQILVPMSNGILRMPQTEIYDAPRFKYRGLMLDSARHFISKQKIFELLEGMAYNKLNVFHWHITDDSAFPFNSTVFPELSAKGAYRADLTYSKGDVREIVKFARQRGIRVVPEFAVPAHTASWGASHPEIMTECFGNFGNQLGSLDPTKDITFKFLFTLFSEIRSLFPDEYLHLGIDNIDSNCWETNPQIQNYLVAKNITIVDLQYKFLERFSTIISFLGWKQIMWQDGITENFWTKGPAGIIGQIRFSYNKTAYNFTANNHAIISSHGWYLYDMDRGCNWEKYYKVEPTKFEGTDEQKKHVLGGEACLWTDHTNEYNAVPTTFPRVSAVAERLWSAKYHRNTKKASPRIEEHNCRMQFRGIGSRPANSYGMC